MASTDRTTTPIKSPAFQFYPTEFLSSSKVDVMSMTERGVYITLLSRCWMDNGLPTDMPSLARMARMKTQQFERLWANGQLRECFIERDGKYQHPRLDQEREKQTIFKRRQADNGGKGGRPKKTHSKPTDNPPVIEDAASYKPTESPRVETEIETETKIILVEEKEEETDSAFDGQRAFQLLVGQYPRHRISTGQRTQSKFIEIVFSDGTPERTFVAMMDNLGNHNRSYEWRVKGMAPNLFRWLDEGLWQRQMDEKPPVGEQLTAKTNRTLAAAAEVLQRRPA